MKIFNLALVLACGVLANTAYAKDESVDLSNGWYNSRGATFNGSTKVITMGPDAFIHKTVTNQIDKSLKYHLEASVSMSGQGKGFIGMAFYGPNKQRVGMVSQALSQSKVSLDIDIPATATSSMVFASTDEKFVGKAEIKDLSLEPSDTKLKYAPPKLVNPETIVLGTGNTYTKLDTKKDYIIKLPSQVKTGSTNLVGGRNVVMIGGSLAMKKGDKDHRNIYIKNNQGVVHIEGILIDNTGGDEADSIAIDAPESIVQIQNVRVNRIEGFYKTWHADLIQPWGGTKALLVDKFTGRSAYQGFQLKPMGTNKNKSSKFSRVNLESLDAQIPQKGLNGGNGGYLLWLTTSGCEFDPMEFSEFYVKARPEKGATNAIWPTPRDKKCPSKVSADKTSMSFFSPLAKGDISLGAPPEGDFVPAGSVGLNYKSPGYLN